jgi:hypothetical protein
MQQLEFSTKIIFSGHIAKKPLRLSIISVTPWPPSEHFLLPERTEAAAIYAGVTDARAASADAG